MDNNNKVIELRQKKADKVYNAGCFNSILSRPVVVSEGDSLAITKCFVDTQAQTDEKIIIEDTYDSIDLTIGAYLYHTNHNISNNDKQFGSAVGNDGKDYVYCQLTPAPDPTGIVKCITEIRVDYNDGGTLKKHQWGDLTGVSFVRLYYNNALGVGTTTLIEIPAKTLIAGNNDTNYQYIGVKILGDPNSVKADPSDPKWNAQRSAFHSVTKSQAPEEGVLIPHIFSKTVNLPAGNYLPQDICRIINNDITDNGIANGDFTAGNLVANPFFHLASDFLTLSLDFMVSTDGTSIFQWLSGSYGNPPTVRKTAFIGASSIELSWDDSASKFYWSYLHQPIFSTGGAIVSQIQQNTVGNKYYFLGKNGGIGFDSLSAVTRSTDENLDGLPYDFWEHKLGFDINGLRSSFTTSTTKVDTGGGEYHIPTFENWNNGKNVIMARPNIDSLVTKSNYEYVSEPITTTQSTNDLTTEIYGIRQVCNPLVLDYGYFMIEVSASFYNEMIGSDDITTNIMGIVNRFYSIGAYTTQDGSNIVYTHKGKDLYLNSIKIRILDSDRQEVPSLGDDNTVFLSLIKAPIEEVQQPMKKS